MRAIERSWNWAAEHLVLTHKSFFKKQRDLELVSLPQSPPFLHDFWRKIFLVLYSNNWSNFIVCLLVLREILAICVLYLLTRLWHKFWNNLVFLIKLSFLTKKLKQKFIYLEKRAFKIKQIKQFFLEGDSPTLNILFS